jgi:hypothetical protein
VNTNIEDWSKKGESQSGIGVLFLILKPHNKIIVLQRLSYPYVLVLKYSTVAGKILTTERTKAQHKHEAP